MIPEGWRSKEGEKCSSQEPGQNDDTWEDGQMIPNGWNSKEEEVITTQ